MTAFRILNRCSHTNARVTWFETLHGAVVTPTFMPVATRASVRGQSPEAVLDAGTQILLSNTYHLMLTPGLEVLKDFGGLHKFMKWDRPILTDSGGYQVFSLKEHIQWDNKGVRVKDPLSGRKLFLTPESVLDAQAIIGSDIRMVLDVCLDSRSSESDLEKALLQTQQWLERAIIHFGRQHEGNPAQRSKLFGIVQGGCSDRLRRESALHLQSVGKGLDGYAIGGLAVGETREERERIIASVTPQLDENKPRYVMGIGTPIDLLYAVRSGVDIFDCILPTAFAQQGVAYTTQGKIQLRRGAYVNSQENLDPGCACSTCAKYTRGYMAHLIRAKEPLGWQLVGTHNLFYYHELMNRVRASIQQDLFNKNWSNFLAEVERSDSQDDRADESHFSARLPESTPKKNFEIVKVERETESFFTLKETTRQEKMHPFSAQNEPETLYVQGTGMPAYFSSAGERAHSEIIVWDVGLGMAANAMAIWNCAGSRLPESSSLKLLSFENDITALEIALSKAALFPWLRSKAPHLLVKNRNFSSQDERLRWEVIEGNFLETFTSLSEKPDFIVYDPFSFKVDPSLWSLECFQKIREFLGDHDTLWVSYSHSTLIRAKLLKAGFNLFRGAGISTLTETTIATIRPLSRTQHQLNSEQWISPEEFSDKFKRSSVFSPDLL